MLSWLLNIGFAGSGAGASVTAKPFGHQRLDNQHAAIAASRLNGVLQ